MGYFHLKLPLPIVNFPTERKLQAEISLFNGKLTYLENKISYQVQIPNPFSVFRILRENAQISF